MNTSHLRNGTGEGVKAEDLNDDCLGRTLDWLYEHDVTRLFAGIAYKAREKLSITYGYSRDHRADLKQWMLALATTQGTDLPLFLRPLDGNSSDHLLLLATVEALQEQLHAPDEQESSIYVADSGLFTQANMTRLNAARLRWVSRVPETLSTAREELAKALQTQWHESTDGELRWYTCLVELPQGQERWVIVSSKGSRTARSHHHATTSRTRPAAVGKTALASASQAFCL